MGGTGRVAPDGSLALTGGGDLKLRLGGVLNPDLDASQYATQYRTNRQKPDLDGMVTNLRAPSRSRPAPSAARASCSARTPSRSPA